MCPSYINVYHNEKRIIINKYHIQPYKLIVHINF